MYTEPSTETTSPALPDRWIAKLFGELQGNYGKNFISMWASGVMVNGEDSGLLIARKTWAKKLAPWVSRPEVIRAVLDNLPPAKVPNLPDFEDRCREMAREMARKAREQESTANAIGYTPTPEDIERQRAAAAALAETAKAKTAIAGVDGMDWARRPGSQIALTAITDEVKRGNRTLASVFDRLVADGVATAEGVLLKRYVRGHGCWQDCRRGA